LIIPTITLYALTHQKLQTSKKQLITLVSIFIATIIGLKLYPYTQKPHVHPVECGKKNLYIFTHPSETIVFDSSALGTKTSIDSWISFTFVSELLKQTGKFTIDHFILRTVSNRALQTLEKINELCPIAHLYLPYSHAITTKTNPLFNSLK